MTFTNTRWADCPDNMLEYVSQQRKLHKQILASSQVFSRVDIKLREQTNFVVECRSFFMGRLIYCKYFNTPEYLAGGDKKDSGRKKRKVVRRHLFVAYDSIRKVYDTEQIMVDLLERDSVDTESTISELIRRLQKK